MTEEEHRELRAWRTRQGLAMVVLAVLIVPAALALTIWAVAAPDAALRSPAVVVLPALLFWVWLLHRAPLRWWRARKDGEAGEVGSLRGPVALLQRRGIGVLAPSRFSLRVRGRSFEIPAFWQEQILPGHDHTVRYAPRSGAVLSVARRENAARPIRKAGGLDLTRREKELLRLIAEGLTDKEIARVLNLSPATVRTYNSALYARLGIERRTQAVPIAQELGLGPRD